jgi:hypothetical protein
VRLDERDLDAVERSGVGEDNSALRVIQRVRCEEFDPISLEARDIVCHVSKLEREVVGALAFCLDEPGNRAVCIVGGNEAERGVA